MDFMLVLNPTHPATRAIAMPGVMPWALTPVEDEPPVLCPTIKCRFVDFSVPHFMRIAGVVGEEDVNRLVWVPLDAVITVFERDDAIRVDPSLSSNAIH